MGYIVRAVLESTRSTHSSLLTAVMPRMSRHFCQFVFLYQLENDLLQQATTSHAEPPRYISADSQPTKGVGRGMTCRRGPGYQTHDS